MSGKSQFTAAFKLVVLSLVGLVLLVAGQSLFKHWRIDLTEDQVFTLSDGTRNIVSQLPQPVTLEFFYSEAAMRDAPTLRNYSQRIVNTLEEFVLLSDGNLSLQLIDPEPFSEQEDRATELGMQAVPLRVGGPQLYLGLAAVGAEREEVMAFLHPNRERYLEYEIAKAIYLASREAPPKLGIMSGLPVNGGLDMATRSMNRPWAAVQQLKELFDIVDLGPNPATIGEDIDLLLVIHPAQPTPGTLFAIDQFVLSGRSAVVFVDPLAETTETAPGTRPMPGAAPSHSNLPQLFSAWGLEMVPDKVLGDAAHAMLVNVGDDMAPARNLVLLGLTTENMASDELLTEELDTLNVSSVGVLRQLENAETQWRELVWSSSAAGLLDVDKVRGLMDPNTLFEDFVPDGVHHAMAGQVSGRAYTAFPAGDPAQKISSEESDGEASTVATEHSATLQQGDINVLIVADTDVLTDRLWVQAQTFLGQPILSPFADNGALLINAADYFAGSPDLISIRSRGSFARPFTRVHEIQRQAEEQYRDTANELAAQLQATEQKLTSLQQLKSGEDKQVLSPEQEQAVDEFLAQKLAIRKSMREVQHQLTSDIEALGTRLKLLNIAALPLLLSLVMLAMAGLRRWRRS